MTLTSAFCSDNRRRIDLLLPTPAPERFEGHEQDQTDQFGDVSSDKDSALGSDIASHAGSTEDAPHGHGMIGQADAAPTSSNSVKSADEAATQDLSLAGILRIPELGIMVLEEVFQTGFHNVEKLAMTSLKMLGLVRRLLVSATRLGHRNATDMPTDGHGLHWRRARKRGSVQHDAARGGSRGHHWRLPSCPRP